MNLPQRPPLPKLPPKGLPPKAYPPGRAPLAASAPVAPAAAAPVPAAPQPAAAAPVMAAPPPQAFTPPPAPPRAAAAIAAALPPIDVAGLSPSLAAMMEAIRIYETLLIEENAMLRAGDSNGVSALLDRKMNATRLYQERQRTVLGDTEATRALLPEQRAQVVAMVKSLEELAKENTILLKANMSAIEQLFEVINNAARKMRKREVAYSQGGVIRDYHNAHTVSLAYNHTV